MDFFFCPDYDTASLFTVCSNGPILYLSWVAVTKYHEQSGLKRYKYTIVLEIKILKIRCQENCVLCKYTGGNLTLLLPSFWGHVGNRSCINLCLLSWTLLDGLRVMDKTPLFHCDLIWTTSTVHDALTNKIIF